MKIKAIVMGSKQEVTDSVLFAVKLGFSECEIVNDSDSKTILDIIKQDMACIIIVDVDSTEIAALEFIQKARLASEVPIIVLGSSDLDTDKVKFLEAGADEYINKPLSILELMVKTRAIVRRAYIYTSEEYTIPRFVSDKLTIDFNSRDVQVNGKSIHLTNTEYRLLATLAKNENRFLDNSSLKDQVWGNDEYTDPAVVKKYMRRLRVKLGDNPKAPKILINARGVGYKLVKPVSARQQN